MLSTILIDPYPSTDTTGLIDPTDVYDAVFRMFMSLGRILDSGIGLGLGLTDGEMDGDGERLGLIDVDTEGDGDVDGLSEELVLGERLGDMLGLTDGDRDWLFDGLSEGLRL